MHSLQFKYLLCWVTDRASWMISQVQLGLALFSSLPHFYNNHPKSVVFRLEYWWKHECSVMWLVTCWLCLVPPTTLSQLHYHPVAAVTNATNLVAQSNKMSSLTVLEDRSSTLASLGGNEVVSRGCVPLEGSRASFLPFPASDAASTPLLVAASVRSLPLSSHCFFLFCVYHVSSLPPSYKDTYDWN